MDRIWRLTHKPHRPKEPIFAGRGCCTRFSYNECILGDPNTQIRLLTLDLETSTHNIVGTLSTVERYNAPDYVAISYTWGDPSRKRSIAVNGRRFDVTENCWYALWQMKHNNVQHPVWIDAICINQHDSFGEKGAQVARMGEVYRKAIHVAVCSGEEDRDSVRLFETIYARESARDGLRFDPSTKMSTDAQRRLSSSIDNFFNRPYFSRLWVVQEVLLAADIEVHCGGDRCQLNEIWTLANDLSNLRHGRWLLWHPVLNHLYKDAKDRGLTSRDPQSWKSEFVKTHALALLSTYGSFNCSDPRDKMYALLGLVNQDGIEVIKADYGVSARWVAMQVLESYQNLPKADNKWPVELPFSNIMALVRHLWSDPLEHAELLRRRGGNDAQEPGRGITEALWEPAVRVVAHQTARVSRNENGEFVAELHPTTLETDHVATHLYNSFEKLVNASTDRTVVRHPSGTVLAIAPPVVHPDDIIVLLGTSFGSTGLLCRASPDGRGFSIEGQTILNPQYWSPAAAYDLLRAKMKVFFDSEDLLALSVQAHNVSSVMKKGRERLSRRFSGRLARKECESQILSLWQARLDAPVTRHPYSSFATEGHPSQAQ